MYHLLLVFFHNPFFLLTFYKKSFFLMILLPKKAKIVFTTNETSFLTHFYPFYPCDSQTSKSSFPLGLGYEKWAPRDFNLEKARIHQGMG